MDMKSHSVHDLVKLRRQIDDELRARHERDRDKAEPDLRNAAEAWGYIADELIFGLQPEAEKQAMGPRYQHPYDPRKTWGGVGQKPAWVEEWEASGHALDELKAGGRH